MPPAPDKTFDKKYPGQFHDDDGSRESTDNCKKSSPELRRIDNQINLFEGMDLSIDNLMADERDPLVEKREAGLSEQISVTYLDSIKKLKPAKLVGKNKT